MQTVTVLYSESCGAGRLPLSSRMDHSLKDRQTWLHISTAPIPRFRAWTPLSYRNTEMPIPVYAVMNQMAFATNVTMTLLRLPDRREMDAYKYRRRTITDRTQIDAWHEIKCAVLVSSYRPGGRNRLSLEGLVCKGLLKWMHKTWRDVWARSLQLCSGGLTAWRSDLTPRKQHHVVFAYGVHWRKLSVHLVMQITG
jgi:hypothetical protein